jgi:hypothetical protein
LSTPSTLGSSEFLGVISNFPRKLLARSSSPARQAVSFTIEDGCTRYSGNFETGRTTPQNSLILTAVTIC